MAGNETIDTFKVNRFVLKSPILIGLSQSYYFKFFIAVFVDIVLLPILVMIFDNPMIGVGITLGLLLSYYLFLRASRKKYGENPLEVKSYKKQDQQIFIDNSRIFYEQANP